MPKRTGHIFTARDGWQLTPGLKVDLEYPLRIQLEPRRRNPQTSNVDLSTGSARFVVAGNPANLSGRAATLAAFAAAQNPSIPVVSNTTANWNDSLLDTGPCVCRRASGWHGRCPTEQNGCARWVWCIHEPGSSQRPSESRRKCTVLSEQTVNNATGIPMLATTGILTANPNGAIGANGVNHDFKIEYNSMESNRSDIVVCEHHIFGSIRGLADGPCGQVQPPSTCPPPVRGAVQAFAVPSPTSTHTPRFVGMAGPAFNGRTFRSESPGLSAARRFDASYTWSHSIDDASDAGTTNAELNLPQNIYAHNQAAEKSGFKLRLPEPIRWQRSLRAAPLPKATSGWARAGLPAAGA